MLQVAVLSSSGVGPFQHLRTNSSKHGTQDDDQAAAACNKMTPDLHGLFCALGQPSVGMLPTLLRIRQCADVLAKCQVGHS